MNVFEINTQTDENQMEINKLQIIKISVITVVVAVVSVVAFFVYQKFADENSASKTNLMLLIPDNCDAFFNITEFDKVEEIEKNYFIKNYLSKKSNPSIFKTLVQLRPYFMTEEWKGAENALHQMIISLHSWENTHAELLLFRAAAGDNERIEDVLDKFFKSSFKPVSEENAGIRVKHYYVSTGINFHCFFYKGIFAGSYSNRLIDETILRMNAQGKENRDPDFLDITQETSNGSKLKFYIRLNGIPLQHLSKPELSDTLNLTEWVAPDLVFDKNSIRMSAYTSPLFEKRNQLSILIGQLTGRPLNPAVIAKECPFVIHYGLSDRERFIQNQQIIFGNPGRDTSLYRSDSLSIDSVFTEHFDSEINIAYFPMMLPERQLEKVITIRLKNEDLLAEKLDQISSLLPVKKEEKAIPSTVFAKTISEKIITAAFGQLFTCGESEVFYDLHENYLIVAARAETVVNYKKELVNDENLNKKIWFNEISAEVDSKSNLFFIGKGDSFKEDLYILPFGLPRFLIENQYLFTNSTFCFQFNAEESFIYSNSIIKQLNP